LLKTTHRQLKFLAVLFWSVGGTILILKGGSLLLAAESLHPHQIWPWLALFSGVGFGGVKARYLFSKIGKKNLIRIDDIHQPKPWQFFRLRFFVMLTLMVILGVSLSRLAQDNYLFLIAVGILELSIAMALIGSSYIFWMRKVFL